MPIFRVLLALLRPFLRDRSQLALENLALPHQLHVLRRNIKQPRLHQTDRLLWIFLSEVPLAESARGTVIDSVQRKWVAHVIAFGEGHLPCVLKSYVEYYNDL